MKGQGSNPGQIVVKSVKNSPPGEKKGKAKATKKATNKDPLTQAIQDAKQQKVAYDAAISNAETLIKQIKTHKDYKWADNADNRGLIEKAKAIL